MRRMATELDLTTLDKRLVERFIKRNQLSEKEWDKHVRSLPDLESQSQSVETRFETSAEESGEE